MEPRTRYTRQLEVGVFQDKIGISMVFDDHREHFLYERSVARDLALKLLQALDQSPQPSAPRALGISVSEDIHPEERIG